MLFLLVTILTVILAKSQAFSQALTEPQIKSAYLYNFAKEITWPNQSQLDTFKIALLTYNNAIYNILKGAEGQKKVKNLPLAVYQSIDLFTLLEHNPQILYVSREFNPQMKFIYSSIRGKKILLVTDELDRIIYTMINFYKEKNRILYKVNKENLTAEGFVPSEDLLVYGGTVYDIMDIFKDKERELELTRWKLRRERIRLDSLKRVYQHQESLFIQQQEKYREALKMKEDSVKDISATLDSLRRLINAQESVLTLSAAQIDKKQREINQLKQQIDLKAEIYNEQIKQIEENRRIIEQQQKSINIYKQLVIEQRRRIIYLVLLLVVLVVFSILIIRFFLINKKMAKELERKNREFEAQAEEQMQLIEELEKLSIVARETENVIFILDKNGKILWVNEAVEKKYKMPQSEFIGKTIPEVSALGPKAYSYFKKCINDKITVSYEINIKLPDGSDMWVQTTLTPIFNGQGEIEKVVAIDTDITNIKAAQKEIEDINRVLLDQQKKLVEQKQEIEEKNALIQSSLEYALTIQDAILPKDSEIRQYFSDYFIIYRPMQIISGDFYWLGSPPDKREYVYAVVADGTGHGVPGAFISLISERLLDEAIKMLGIESPKEILKFMDREIDKLIVKDDAWEAPVTGVDLILLRIRQLNQQEFEVTFSGAKRPLVYYIPGANDLEYIRTTRRSLSNPLLIDMPVDYEEYTVIVPKDTVFYLYTDGYVDQVCHDTQKRIGTKRFLRLLWTIRNLSFSDQKYALEEYLDNCLKNEVQRDDITIWAIKL